MGLEVATFISELVATNPTGADDYATTDDHLRLVKSVLQAQFPNFTAAAVNTNVADLNLLVGAGGGIFKLPTDIVTATPPVAELVTGSYDIYDLDKTDRLARFGYAAGNTLLISSFMHGAAVRMQGKGAAGIMRTIIDGDPDDSSSMYHAGVLKLVTTSDGIDVTGDVGGTTIGGIIEANLVDKTATEVITASSWQFGAGTPSSVRRLNIIDGAQVLAAFDGTNIISSIVDINNTNVAPTGGIGTRYQVAGAAVAFSGWDNTNSLWKVSQDHASVAWMSINAAGNLSATSHGGIIEANLLDKTAAEAITASWALDTPLSVRSLGNTDAENRKFQFSHQDGTSRATIGHETSDVFVVRNQIHGGNVLITAEDGVGTPRTILQGDPDAVTILRAGTDLELQVAAGELAFKGFANARAGMYFNNLETARTLVAASGGMEVDNQSTGAGFERVLTTGDGVPAIVKVKASDTTHSLDVIPGNDPDLTYAIPSTGKYAFELFVTFWGSTTGTQGINLNVNYSGTVGVGSRWGAYARTNASGNSGIDSPVSSVVSAIGFTATLITATAYSDHITIKGVLNATTTGTLAFASSQQASEANNTNIGQNSYLKVTKLS